MAFRLLVISRVIICFFFFFLNLCSIFQLRPSTGVSLRAIETEKYKVVDQLSNEVLEEIEESRAFFQVVLLIAALKRTEICFSSFAVFTE